MAITLRALCAVGAALALTACATTPPSAVTASPSAPGPSAGDSASPSPSVPATSSSPSASTSGTPSATPASTAIVLQAKGIGSAAFGNSEAKVEAALKAAAGKPDETYSGKVCELDSATPYGRQVMYGGAVFQFQSKANGKRTSPRTFTSWVINIEEPLKKSMKLADGYPVKTSFAKLKTAFPKGKLSRVTLGESVVHVFRTPSGIWYRGDDSTTPNDIGAGPMGTCE